MATGEHDNDQPASPWSRTSVQLSTLFVLMLLVVGISIAIFHHGASPKTATSNHPKGAQTSPAGTTTSAAANSGQCSLPTGSQEVPSASPPSGVTWQEVGAMSAPQSSDLGPQHVENGINICFAHNPAGALVAALDIWAEATGNISTKRLWDERAIDVPSGVANETGVLDGQGSFQIAGYKYVSYSADTAQLVVVLQTPKITLLAIQMPMQWVDNDWKFVYPASGGPVMQVLSDETLSSPYVPWSEF